MNKIKAALIVCLILLSACTKKVEKPKISPSDYATQSITIRGMLEKIMNDSDPKKMHEIALAIESSRAISCVPVSEECNLLSKILNKIVLATRDGVADDNENIEIYQLINKMDQELKIGQEKIALQWKEYEESKVLDRK